MTYRITRLLLGIAIALAPCRMASADDEALPTVHTLACTEKCADFVPPKALDHSLPSYPDRNDPYYVEGYVKLQYHIDADGHVGDIALLQLVGPQAFADSTIRTVKDWTYTPAMLNGKPVAICHTLLMNFRFKSYKPGARPEIIHAYHQSVAAIQDGKFDDAHQTLADALVQPKLNFYERGMLANLSALVALQKGDYVEARRMTALVTDHGVADLNPEVQRTLWDSRIRASLSMGDVVDAQEAMDRLKAMPSFKPDAPIIKIMQDAQTQIDAKPIVAIQGRIPDAGDGAGFYVGLYRRSFAFQGITGSLAKFTLSCRQQAIESEISEKAEWHVPKSWSDCRVLVRGAPGTTFKILQEV
jgi:TonB family protein